MPFARVPYPVKGRSVRRERVHAPQPFRGRAAAQKAAGMDGNAAKKPVTAACYPLLSKPPDSVMIKLTENGCFRRRSKSNKQITVK